ncbi:hypothetical protein C0J50_23120 [Silurus asotus]|uniref:Uncharacterized protein n=1 Tax=Silurus asotus TaxID=30991 RepID=A0AAD5FIX8_SILAS|nr:hypothetical protein C0J50_23120 [Silurus asotus]
MRGQSSISVLLLVLFSAAETAGGFSGDDDSYRSQRYLRLSPILEQPARSLALAPKRTSSTFRQVPRDHQELSFLAKTDEEERVEDPGVSARHIVTVIVNDEFIKFLQDGAGKREILELGAVDSGGVGNRLEPV